MDQINNGLNEGNQKLDQASNLLNKACDNLSGDMKTRCEEAKNGSITSQVKSEH